MSCVVILVSRRYRKATWILSSLANCRNDVFWDWSCRLNVRGVVLICLATVARSDAARGWATGGLRILPTAPIRKREVLKQGVAKRDRGRVRGAIAELWRRVEIRRVKYDSIGLMPECYWTAGDRTRDLKVRGGRISEQNLARLEPFAHDVTLQGDMRRDLQLRDEAVEPGIDLRMRQRFDCPYPNTIALLERNGRKGRGQLMISDREVHGAAEVVPHSIA